MVYIPTKEEIQNQKALIGDFIIRFEQTCARIRFAILRICYPNWTVIQNNNIETLLEGLTADPLRKKLEALIFDNFPNEHEILSQSKKLSDKFEKVIPIRNSIAHGSMLIGWNNLEGKLSADTLLLKHSKSTRSGIDRNSMIINIKSIEKLIIQTQLIESAYSILYVLTDEDINAENKELYLNQLKEMIDKIGTIKLDFENKVKK